MTPSGQQVELVWGHQRATIVEVGGGIRSYTVGDEDVLDGYSADEMCTSGRGQLLVPWPNRLEDGNYRFDGEQLQVPLSEPAKHNAIHGLVRFANWVPSVVTPAQAVMTHRLHPQPGFPWLVDLSADYRLDDTGLTLTLEAVNRSKRACPFGAGAHPYLRTGSEVVDTLELQSPAATWYRTDQRSLPTGQAPVEASELDFRSFRLIGDQQLDTAFTDLQRGSDGRATVELRDPSRRRTVRLWLGEGYDYLMLFTGDTLPPARRRRGLGVEPMTCAPNAFRSGDGLTQLQPGRPVRFSWGIQTEGFEK